MLVHVILMEQGWAGALNTLLVLVLDRAQHIRFVRVPVYI